MQRFLDERRGSCNLETLAQKSIWKAWSLFFPPQHKQIWPGFLDRGTVRGSCSFMPRTKAICEIVVHKDFLDEHLCNNNQTCVFFVKISQNISLHFVCSSHSQKISLDRDFSGNQDTKTPVCSKFESCFCRNVCTRCCFFLSMAVHFVEIKQATSGNGIEIFHEGQGCGWECSWDTNTNLSSWKASLRRGNFYITTEKKITKARVDTFSVESLISCRAAGLLDSIVVINCKFSKDCCHYLWVH